MQAGATDRLSSDDGGHYIAARFNGPSDTFNHFAQDANFNRGAYRALEDKWANDMANGQHVSVEISPLYTVGSVRPYMILVRWTEAGKVRLNRFNNRRGGK